MYDLVFAYMGGVEWLLLHMAYFLNPSIVIPNKHPLYRESLWFYRGGENGELGLYFFIVYILKKV